MYFHVIHYIFTWYFIVPLPFPLPPTQFTSEWLSLGTKKEKKRVLLVACWSFMYEPEMCNKIYVSLHEYFINIEHFFLFCIYYNSIWFSSEVAFLDTAECEEEKKNAM